ncbi:SapC family protein [Catenovulum sediminis]|uniref:SapC family protein n=1 Tax=Catenovulum sediminis TaxID=1740262 RepID=A0ABV1RIH9_9ALTE|nr:SapC family protein [Catenovulum sediminis]
MSDYQILDPKTHAKLTVEPALIFANAHHQFAPICLAEVPQIAVNYPIFIAKHPNTGQFGLQAMLGLNAQENLFLQENTWQSAYVPLYFATQPFRLSVEQNDLSNAKVTVDVEHASVQAETGDALFDKNSNQSDILKKAIASLQQLFASIQHNQNFFNTLSNYELLERVQLNINANYSSNLSTSALYNINERALNKLSSAQTHELHQSGYLAACYLILASKLKVQSLINLKQHKLHEVENA